MTIGISATTAYINGNGGESIAAATSAMSASGTASADPSVIVIRGSDLVTDPGAGDRTIQFLSGTSADTLVPHTNSLDQVSGFDPAKDVLDLRSMLSEANVDLTGDLPALSNYLTVVDQGSNALLNCDPTGHGGGSTVAVLQGLGATVTGLDSLSTLGAIRIV